MKGYPIISPDVSDMIGVSISGNVIPLTWYTTVKRTRDVEGGRKLTPKPDLAAITILADIVYWFRPILERDEDTGKPIKYRQKFKADMLQRSYSAYEELYGLGEFQVRDAFDTLEKVGVVTMELRTIKRDGKSPLCNVMFISLNVKRLKEITYPDGIIGDENGDVRIKPHTHVRIKPHTYTETTCTETNIINTPAIAGVSSPSDAEPIKRENIVKPKTKMEFSASKPVTVPMSGLEPTYEKLDAYGEPVIAKKSKKRGAGNDYHTSIQEKGNEYPITNFHHSVRPLVAKFIEASGVKPLYADSSLWQKQAKLWLSLGATPEKVEKAVHRQRERGLALAGPQSITYMFRDPRGLDDYMGITKEDLVAKGFVISQSTPQEVDTGLTREDLEKML